VILRLDLSKIQAGDAKENVRVEDEDMIFIPKGQAYFVLGEVKSAGTFALDKPTTVLEAITMAGGFNERAAPSGAKIVRRDPDGRQETFALDLSGQVPKDRDFPIQSGDTLLIPKGNTFFVFGEVKRPGSYQLDKETNILEAVTIAGGFTEKAAPGRVRVIRNTPKGQQVFNVDMNDIIKRGDRGKAVALQENDVVVVPESFF
jgi:polysaccharide export outer membrane protein